MYNEVANLKVIIPIFSKIWLQALQEPDQAGLHVAGHICPEEEVAISTEFWWNDDKMWTVEKISRTFRYCWLLGCALFRLLMLQTPKVRYLRVQLTELYNYKMRPAPKKAHPIRYKSIVHYPFH